MSWPSFEVLARSQPVPLIKSIPQPLAWMGFHSLGHYAPELIDLGPAIRQLGTALIKQNLHIYSKKPIHKEAKKLSHPTPLTMHTLRPSYSISMYNPLCDPAQEPSLIGTVSNKVLPFIYPSVCFVLTPKTYSWSVDGSHGSLYPNFLAVEIFKILAELRGVLTWNSSSDGSLELYFWGWLSNRFLATAHVWQRLISGGLSLTQHRWCGFVFNYYLGQNFGLSMCFWWPLWKKLSIRLLDSTEMTLVVLMLHRWQWWWLVFCAMMSTNFMFPRSPGVLWVAI